MVTSVIQSLITTSIVTVITIACLQMSWNFLSKLFDDTSRYIRRWEKNENIKPLKGTYGRIVMWHIRKRLKERYSELPLVGDLIQAHATDKIYIVTHRHQPEPISPFGYIDLMNIEEGKNTTTRVPVMSYFKDSYDKVVPDEAEEG